MEAAISIDAFCARPVNHWVAAGSAVVWCASEDLCGCAFFGTPDLLDAAETVRAFEAIHDAELGPRFSLVLDASRVQKIESVVVPIVVEWVGRNRSELLKRVRLQVGLVPPGAAGAALGPIVQALGELHLYRVVDSLYEAFNLVAPGNTTLVDEVTAITEHVMSVPVNVRRLRQLLANDSSSTVDQAARMLSLSPRSLARELTDHGTAFNDEVKAARYTKACYLLESTDDDPRDVANAVGLSEPTLNQLFKEKARIAPSDYRNRSRG